MNNSILEGKIDFYENCQCSRHHLQQLTISLTKCKFTNWKLCFSTDCVIPAAIRHHCDTSLLQTPTGLIVSPIGIPNRPVINPLVNTIVLQKKIIITYITLIVRNDKKELNLIAFAFARDDLVHVSSWFEMSFTVQLWRHQSRMQTEYFVIGVFLHLHSEKCYTANSNSILSIIGVLFINETHFSSL